MRKIALPFFILTICLNHSAVASDTSEGMQLKWMLSEQEAASVSHDQFTHTFFENGTPQKVFLSKEILASNVDVECAIIVKPSAGSSDSASSTSVTFVFTDKGAARMRERVREKTKVKTGEPAVRWAALLLNGRLVSVGMGIFFSTGAIKPTILSMRFSVPLDQARELLRGAGFEPLIWSEQDKLPIYPVPGSNKK